MRQALAPVLFDNEPRGDRRPSPTAPAVRSPEARAKVRSQSTADDWPVLSFQDWLKDLATIAKNHIEPHLRSLPAFEMITRPTAVQQYALDIRRVTLGRATPFLLGIARGNVRQRGDGHRTISSRTG